jgi:hypothetical protein
MTPPADSMREILMGGASKNQHHDAAVTCCCLPRTGSRLRLAVVFDPSKSPKQTAIRHLGIAESQKKLSGEVFP